MSDERLRERQRRWLETRSSQDEAAYLLERVRTGDLEHSKLELVAALGAEGARCALGRSDLSDPISTLARGAELDDLGNVLAEMHWEYGVEAGTRVCLAGFAVLLELRFHDHDWRCVWHHPMPEEAAVRALEAFESLVVYPGEEGALRLRDAWQALQRFGGFFVDSVPITHYAFDPPSLEDLGWVLREVLRAGREEQVRERVGDEVVPWALGDFDPVRERVEARVRMNPRT